MEAHGATAETADLEVRSTLWPPEPLAQLLEPRRQVVPVVGSGISVGDGGMPSTAELAGMIAERLPTPAGGFSDVANLDAVLDDANPEPHELQAVVGAALATRTAIPTELTRQLVAIESRLIVTLNYDDQLELSAAEVDVPFETLSNSDSDLDRAQEVLLRPDTHDRLVILHLHGYVHRAGTFVLGSDTYGQLAGRDVFRHIVQHLAAGKNLCFIGTTLQEIPLLANIADVRRRRNPVSHLILCRHTNRQTIENALTPNRYRHGIEWLEYDDHADLDGFVERLVGPERTISSIEPVAIGSPEFEFVDLDVYRYGSVPTEEERFKSAIGAGSEARTYAPADLASIPRSLIIGPPGSGKSELARAIGRDSIPGEIPVFIRCADLQPAIGDAETLLVSCLKQSDSLVPDSVDLSSVNSCRFHLLFDGFDEQRLSNQGETAVFIRRLAEHLPQHRFTVTSRNVPALTAITALTAEPQDDESWEAFEVSPSERWRDEYLEACDVSLDALEAELPALEDARELLNVPFFLAQTVRLREAGQLRDVPDLLALCESFVVSTIQIETTLTLPNDGVVEWLQRVATTMSLTGNPSLEIARLREINLPPALAGVIGTPEELIAELATRMLLRQSETQVSFAHRILGEALFAKTLVESEIIPELVASIAPVGIPGVSGVRSDLALPVAMAMWRDSRWRDAVRTLDPLAAARATPMTAQQDEVTASASAIWDSYVSWNVWIWQRRESALLDDSRALSRLLSSPGCAQLREQIRQAIDAESPQTQGNAIHVLAETGDASLEDKLGEIIDDDSRNGVVRRQSATAAGNLGLVSLRQRILEALDRSADQVASQEFTYAALALTDRSEWVNLGIRLAANSEARLIISSRIRSLELGADALPFLAAVARIDIETPSFLIADAFDDAMKDLAND